MHVNFQLNIAYCYKIMQTNVSWGYFAKKYNRLTIKGALTQVLYDFYGFRKLSTRKFAPKNSPLENCPAEKWQLRKNAPRKITHRIPYSNLLHKLYMYIQKKHTSTKLETEYTSKLNSWKKQT